MHPVHIIQSLYYRTQTEWQWYPFSALSWKCFIMALPLLLTIDMHMPYYAPVHTKPFYCTQTEWQWYPFSALSRKCIIMALPLLLTIDMHMKYYAPRAYYTEPILPYSDRMTMVPILCSELKMFHHGSASITDDRHAHAILCTPCIIYRAYINVLRQNDNGTYSLLWVENVSSWLCLYYWR